MSGCWGVEGCVTLEVCGRKPKESKGFRPSMHALGRKRKNSPRLSGSTPSTEKVIRSRLIATAVVCLSSVTYRPLTRPYFELGPTQSSPTYRVYTHG